MKKEGATRSARLVRQEKVYKLHLRGCTISEISQGLGCSRRTIERDLQEINISLSQNIHASELLSLKMAFAQMDEVYREAWILYGQAPRKKTQRIGREIVMVQEDDSRKKLRILGLIHGIIATKIEMMYPIWEAAGDIPLPASPSPIKITTDDLEHAMKLLTPEEQLAVTRTISKLKNAGYK